MRNQSSTGTTCHSRFSVLATCGRARVLQVAAMVVLLSGVAQDISAREITVHISKRGASVPVGAASVCLGTPANIAQFGARLADEKGIVQFDKVHPRAEMVLTVSKSGYKGRQVFLGTNQRDREVLLTLAAGGGGPECAKAGAITLPIAAIEPRTAPSLPGIDDFRINSGQPATRSATVTLNYRMTGEASHYRASERSDFEAAEWLPLEPEVRYDLTGPSGLKTVYFQVGKFASAEGAEIEILSNVAVDSIELFGG